VRLAQDRHVPVSEILAEGGHPLERLAALIGLGDYASVYLALGYGLDPAPVPSITELMARITQ
jgi:Bacterial phospho-glucose isomerase C-terminal region.